MTKNFQIQLSWKDPVTGEQREPNLSLPIALGREFSYMPVELKGKRVARMLLKSNQVSRYHAFPLFIVYLFSKLLASPNRKSIGIYEPIDGILLGTASATGFALVETMMDVHEEI
ncbi:hypothetical protein NUACC21_28870 [Scytonema sp. NUACC21]